MISDQENASGFDVLIAGKYRRSQLQCEASVSCEISKRFCRHEGNKRDSIADRPSLEK